MSDNDIPSSGSRWEPTDSDPNRPVPPTDGPAAGPAPAAGGAATEHLTTPMAHGPVPTSGAPARPGRLRRRSALAAAGVGLVLAGGLGGFAIGHAIAGTDVSEQGTVSDSDQDGFPDGPSDGGRGGRPDFDHDGTVPGQTVPGQSVPGRSDPGSDDGDTA